MFRIRIKHTVAMLFALACACASAAPSALAGADAEQLAQAALGELAGTVSVGVLREGKLTVAVRSRSRPGEPLLRPKGPEPVFEIGSISKVFTGLLVAQRVERGELRLDDTLGTLLKDRVQFRYDSAAAIRVRHLLTHTSCLRRWPASFTEHGMFEQATRYQREQLWSELGNLVVGRSLPCETRYSNVGYAALGDILAQRSQRTWESLVVDEVAKPLGLADTRQNLSPAQQARRPEPWDGARRSQFWEPGVFAPAGGLRSTATDLLVFSQALLKGRKGPLGAAPERLVTDLAPFGEQGTRIGYGVLMPTGPAPTWLHNGETRAFLAEWIVWPQTQEAVVMLASNRQAPIGDIRRALVAQTSTATAQEIVYTRGEFRGTFEEDGGRKLYARVKIAPGYKIPFSTLSYRVLDRKLLAGIQPGAAVDFRAERIDGENTIVALRAAAP